MKCSIKGCSGNYEHKVIDQTFRKNGQVVVVEGIPAEVCDICGDSLLTPETSRKIDDVLSEPKRSPLTAPLFKFA